MVGPGATRKHLVVMNLKNLFRRKPRHIKPEVLTDRERELIAMAKAELADEQGNSSEIAGRVDLPSKEEFQKNNPMKTKMNFLY